MYIFKKFRPLFLYLSKCFDITFNRTDESLFKQLKK